MAGDRAGYIRVYGLSGAIICGLWAYATFHGSINDGRRVLHPGPDSARLHGPVEPCENSNELTIGYTTVADVAE